MHATHSLTRTVRYLHTNDAYTKVRIKQGPDLVLLRVEITNHSITLHCTLRTATLTLSHSASSRRCFFVTIAITQPNVIADER